MYTRTSNHKTCQISTVFRNKEAEPTVYVTVKGECFYQSSVNVLFNIWDALKDIQLKENKQAYNREKNLIKIMTMLMIIWK